MYDCRQETRREFRFELLCVLRALVVVAIASTLACTKTQFSDKSSQSLMQLGGGNYNGTGFQGKSYYHFDLAICQPGSVLDENEAVAHAGKLILGASQSYYDESGCDGRSGRILTSQEQAGLAVRTDAVVFGGVAFSERSTPDPINSPNLSERTGAPTTPFVSCRALKEHSPGSIYVFELDGDIGVLTSNSLTAAGKTQISPISRATFLVVPVGPALAPVANELRDTRGDVVLTISTVSLEGRLTSKSGLVADEILMSCNGNIFKP